MRGRGRGSSGLPSLLAARCIEPDVPPVGVEFSVLELWSLGKLFSSPPVSLALSWDRSLSLSHRTLFPAICLGRKRQCSVRGGMVSVTVFFPVALQ